MPAGTVRGGRGGRVGRCRRALEATVAALRSDRRRRRRQGGGGHGARRRARLARTAVGIGRHALRSWCRLPARRGAGSRPSAARRGRSRGREPHARSGLRSDRRRSRAVPGLGRRVVAAGAARARRRACRRARDRHGAAAQRGADHCPQLRAQAPLGDHGRTSCGRRLAGAGVHHDHLRRAWRRPVGDRLGPHRRRPDDLPGGTRRPRAL